MTSPLGSGKPLTFLTVYVLYALITALCLLYLGVVARGEMTLGVVALGVVGLGVLFLLILSEKKENRHCSMNKRRHWLVALGKEYS